MSFIESKPRWDVDHDGSPPSWRASTISNHLVASAARTPNRTAITYDGRTIPYAELDEMASRAANGMLALGVRPGDVVGLRAHNRPETLACFYGLARAGITILPLSPRLVGDELTWQLRDIEAAKLIDDDGLGDYSVADVMAKGTAGHPDIAVDENAYVWVRFTSGTTGRPKAVATTQKAAANLFESFALGIGQSPSDKVLVIAPVAHAAIATAANAIVVGGSIVLEPGFDPDRVWPACDEHGVTLVFMVPTMFALTLDKPGDGSSIRTFLSMASIFSPALKRRVQARFPQAGIFDCYAGTELGAATILRPEDIPAKPSSVGLPAFGCRIRILDDDGHQLPAGEIGSIYVQGPAMCAAFVGSVPPSPTTIRDGFLTPGDLGYLDDDGFLFLVDRRTDLIVSGGYNVYPSEVEDVLISHPGVVSVAVIGIPDDTWGQVVTAVVQGTPDPAELDQLCRERLAGYKVPRRYEFVDALPLNPSGKVLKRQLRETFATPNEGGLP